MKDFHHVV